MISVFVSYRRDDSRYQAGRLYDHLVEKFGEEHVFKDVNSILPGLDFREVLAQRVASCDVLLAVIGDEWLSISGPNGARRLDNPGDYVRIEIEGALDRGIPVIPVLVGNSSVPRAEELPETLRALAHRQATLVRPDPDFHRDVERLWRGIEDAVSALRRSPERRPARTRWLIALAVSLIGLMAAAVIITLGRGNGRETEIRVRDDSTIVAGGPAGGGEIGASAGARRDARDSTGTPSHPGGPRKPGRTGKAFRTAASSVTDERVGGHAVRRPRQLRPRLAGYLRSPIGGRGPVAHPGCLRTARDPRRSPLPSAAIVEIRV